MEPWMKVKRVIMDPETGEKFELKGKALRIESRTIFDVPDGVDQPSGQVLAEAGAWVVIEEPAPAVPMVMSKEQFEKYYQVR